MPMCLTSASDFALHLPGTTSSVRFSVIITINRKFRLLVKTTILEYPLILAQKKREQVYMEVMDRILFIFQCYINELYGKKTITKIHNVTFVLSKTDTATTNDKGLL